MYKRHALGRNGERVAENYLRQHGYKIKERNYRYRRCEIDMICMKDDSLIFVEVKTRSGTRFGFPEDFVSDLQAERIAEAAFHYMEECAWKGNYMFDIIAILWQGSSCSVTHFEAAF
jgi:putative endonuclease